jgi:hypothetical protein
MRAGSRRASPSWVGHRAIRLQSRVDVCSVPDIGLVRRCSAGDTPPEWPAAGGVARVVDARESVANRASPLIVLGGNADSAIVRRASLVDDSRPCDGRGATEERRNRRCILEADRLTVCGRDF